MMNIVMLVPSACPTCLKEVLFKKIGWVVVMLLDSDISHKRGLLMLVGGQKHCLIIKAVY